MQGQSQKPSPKIINNNLHSMPKYIIWYKKKITAKNLKQAINEENKTKALFHSIVEEKQENIIEGAAAIGFEYNVYDDDDDNDD